MIDAHCHILPNCDDGSQSMQESVDMLNAAKQHGIERIVCTSHMKRKYAGFDYQIEMHKELKSYANCLGIQTALGAEVYWENFSQANIGEIKKWCLGDSNIILVEFATSSLTNFWEQLVYKLLGEGLQVVIVHPERMHAVHKDFNLLYSFINAGCKLMLSATSFNKRVFGSKTFKTAKHALKENLIDLIASDAHSINSYKYFDLAWKIAQRYGYDKSANQPILSEVF